MGYTKLFSSLVASTIWREDLYTKIVWITMLALKNERHVVEASVPGLAHISGVPIEKCQAALDKLESPDKHSRNQSYEGRRIQKCDGGWEILNGEYYRKLLSAEDRREYKRVWAASYRKRVKKERHDVAKANGAMDAIEEGLRDAEEKEKPIHGMDDTGG